MAASSALALRLNYFVERARRADLPRVWRMAGHIGERFHKPRLLVAADMLWSAARHDCAFQDFQDFDFAILDRRERATFMTHPRSDHYALRFNTDKQANRILADKSQFNAHFPDVLGRDWLDIRTADDEALAAFLHRHDDIMAKVPDSLGGKGIQRLRAADRPASSSRADLAAFRETRTTSRQFLLEEFLTQHEQMRALNPSSVNTMRIVTFNDGTRTSVLAVALRIGAGGDIDNFSGGGMYTMVNADGVVEYAAFDDEDAVHATHPLSGVDIVGFRVPLFRAALELAMVTAQRIPEVPYIGWDVAITPHRPVIIEGNYNTGIFQTKPSVSGVRRGLLPRYRAVIGE